MSSPESESRRRLLLNIALTASVGTLAATQSRAADAALPLISEKDPAAVAVKYVEDAKKAKEAAGNTCNNCSLYGGKDGSVQGACQIFKGKAVKAAGWCNAWAAQE